MAMTWKTVWKASAMRPRLPAATPYADCASASADSAPTKVSSERDSRPDSAASKSAEARADHILAAERGGARLRGCRRRSGEPGGLCRESVERADATRTLQRI